MSSVISTAKNGSIGSLTLSDRQNSSNKKSNDALQPLGVLNSFQINGAPSPPPRPPSNEEQMICMVREDRMYKVKYKKHKKNNQTNTSLKKETVRV